MKVLCVADLHLRHDRPICRLDEDWLESQRTDLSNIDHIIFSEGIEEVWLLGDVFHRPVEPPEVVNMALEEMSNWKVKAIRAICGNHDLAYHSIENFDASSIATLFKSGLVKPFEEHWDAGTNIAAYNFGTEKEVEDDGAEIVLTHQLVFPDENSRGLAGGKIPSDIKKQFPNAKLVLMGDYHDGWNTDCDGQKQVMVGCMNVQSGKLATYNPRVAIIDTDHLDTCSFKYLPQGHATITTEHLVESKERDKRLEACVDSLSNMKSCEFDFIGNLKKLASANNKVSGVLDEMIEALNKNEV